MADDPLDAFGGADFKGISEDELAAAGFGTEPCSDDSFSDDSADFGDDIAAAGFGNVFDPEVGKSSGGNTNLEMVFEIPVRLCAELGDTTISIKDLMSFGPGSVIELQRLAGEPANLMVNGVLVGKGDVVVVNENYGLRITELISAEERVRQLAQ